MRVAVLHTVPAVQADLTSRFAAAGLTDVQHRCDPSLLADLLAGADMADVALRIDAHLRELAANADLVATSCSSLTPAVQQLRASMGVPVIAVDEPLAAAAVRAGSRLALVCTAESTVAPSTALIEGAAREAGVTIELDVRVVAGAFAALTAGDLPSHDALVTAEVDAVSRAADVVVLAQASLARLGAHLAERTGLPVLSSPPLLVDALRQRAAN